MATSQEPAKDPPPTFAEKRPENRSVPNPDLITEADHLRQRVGLVDLSHRDRYCLLGDDRHRFLNGQVTNNIRDLQPGNGCYALSVSNKGIIQGDCNVYALPDEILLDLEPGEGASFVQRLEAFIVADDVEIVDVTAHFGLLTLQGPLALSLLEKATELISPPFPMEEYGIAKVSGNAEGEIYVTKHDRTGRSGYDLYVAIERLSSVKQALLGLARNMSGDICQPESLETLRIEAGIPRFPDDMQPSVLAPELRMEESSISYSKGCYIGQEVINRIKSIGKVNRELVGLTFEGAASIQSLPTDLVDQDKKRVGRLTSCQFSVPLGKNLGLALVKTSHSSPGTELFIDKGQDSEPDRGKVSSLPFQSLDSLRIQDE